MDLISKIDLAESDPMLSGAGSDRAFNIAGFLDDIERRLRENLNDAEHVHRQLDAVCYRLLELRERSSAEWQATVHLCRMHPLLQLVHEDPLTKRAFLKPRGYAGDACLMDMLYGIEEHWPPPSASIFGKHVFDYIAEGPAGQAVRSRRALVAASIDRIAEERKNPHVLAIAAGHLREVNLSVAVRRGLTGRVVALDSDALSLAEVESCYAKFGVETVLGSFARLLDAREDVGRFDFVYATGLFDYLSARSARKLLLAMHRLLRPEGELLVANFLPAIRDVGYLEAFMDWKLVYRTRQDMVELTGDIPEAQIYKLELASEAARNVIFLRLTRT